MHSWLREEIKLLTTRIEKSLVITLSEIALVIILGSKTLSISREEGLLGITLPGFETGYLFDDNFVILFDDGSAIGVD